MEEKEGKITAMLALKARLEQDLRADMIKIKDLEKECALKRKWIHYLDDTISESSFQPASALLSDFNAVLGTISILGALFIGYLGYENITLKGFSMGLQKPGVTSLKKGVVTNFLSPHPYLFWMVVGAPIVMKAYRENITSVIVFMAGFYVVLVGSKITLAFLVERSKAFLKSAGYVYTVRILGGVLILFAGIFFRDGLRFFGVIQF